MPRSPSIWWRESHQSYYTTISGRQVRLDPDRRKAEAEFYRLMAGQGREPARRIRLGGLTELWLAAKRESVALGTFATWQATAQRWCRSIGRIVACDLKPYHVQGWLDSETTWGKSTKSLAISRIKGCLTWAVDQGHLEKHPLSRLRATKIARREPATEADVAAFLAACRCEATRQFSVVALETGCRPGELASLAAAQVDLAGRRATVVGKTGRRTVPLSDAACAILGPLAARRPDGPLLRSPQGRRWTRTTLCLRFKLVNKEAGTKLVPYHFRGVFATRSLRVNGDIVTARLLGHTSLAMLAAHYEGLDQDDLREAMDRISSGPDSAGSRSRRRGGRRASGPGRTA